MPNLHCIHEMMVLIHVNPVNTTSKIIERSQDAGGFHEIMLKNLGHQTPNASGCVQFSSGLLGTVGRHTLIEPRQQQAAAPSLQLGRLRQQLGHAQGVKGRLTHQGAWAPEVSGGVAVCFLRRVFQKHQPINANNFLRWFLFQHGFERFHLALAMLNG